MIFKIFVAHGSSTNNIINNKLFINIDLYTADIIFTIKSHKDIDIKFIDVFYYLNAKFIYNFVFKNCTNLSININRLYEQIISLDDIEFIYIHNYGNAEIISTLKNQIVYSFDKNYFIGAFASIYSLIYNTSPANLAELNLNIILPCCDLSLFINQYEKLFNIIKINLCINLFLINIDLIDSAVKKTACFKGGHHLLKLSNYARLIIGHLINCPRVLYLDADTIIQHDITKIFDYSHNDFIILGKKSALNYNNLFNSNNKHLFNIYINNNNDDTIFNKNVIYTGTLIINPKYLYDNFNNMIDIVKLHNSIADKGGLYKLFTMSIINIGLFNKIDYFDNILNNVVDLGHKCDIPTSIIDSADVLDWSGMYKPWFTNGLYQQYWKKYNLLYDITESNHNSKNTTENFD